MELFIKGVDSLESLESSRKLNPTGYHFELTTNCNKKIVVRDNKTNVFVEVFGEKLDALLKEMNKEQIMLDITAITKRNDLGALYDTLNILQKRKLTYLLYGRNINTLRILRNDIKRLALGDTYKVGVPQMNGFDEVRKYDGGNDFIVGTPRILTDNYFTLLEDGFTKDIYGIDTKSSAEFEERLNEYNAKGIVRSLRK